MNFEFMRCYICGKITEKRKLLRETSCYCGSRKVTFTNLSFVQLWIYILTHFECIKLIFGDIGEKDEK